MEIQEVFDVVDMHVGGEPLRIITSGYPALPGRSLLDKRAYLQEHLDRYRQLLMLEPWGHEEMYGCLVVDPERRESLYGLIFLHNEGYSTMCGHAIIAVTRWLVDTRKVSVPAGAEDVALKMDVPSGQIVAHARLRGDQVSSVWFENVPAFAVELNRTLVVGGRDLVLDVGFGGAYYAIVEAAQLGLSVEPEAVDALREWAGAIKAEVESLNLTDHPGEPRLNGLYGVIFTDPPHDSDHFSRNLTIFANGQVDRSPCGSCVSTRLAVWDAKGTIDHGRSYAIESVMDSVFTGSVVGEGPSVGRFSTVRTVVEGCAYFSGFRRFFGSSHDAVGPFLMR